ncbi:MAG: putative Dynein-1-beta heavy chain, flagellar inner arm I1 complex [Streblomastix strix]|uniref:Putative Dynein-1-beta heavy chain, flagellar inner arm I1 complex n=1 Tax=Streblomastix strix TaxID=222440 RepID=A0A5J4U2T1_9EUKA|nr:MAG: putative Dynein-1-beta heavy chain, flagellar inner arm I1 complex [Streblomastix strix]
MFLNILKQPCEALAKAAPIDIPNIIPQILPLVLFIWKNSDTYRPRLGSLLPKFSNEVIRRCQASIFFEDIFNGNVSYVIQALMDSVQAGRAWEDQINSMLKSVKGMRDHIEEYRNLEWKVDAKDILPKLLAFMQRCRELIDVCSSYVQFGIKLSTKIPLFTGPSGMTLETSFNDTQAKFTRYISALKGLKYNVLDAQETKWHEDYTTLKDNIGDLEQMLSSTIGAAFQYANSVQQALDVYKTLKRVAVRKHIKDEVEKNKSAIWHLFKSAIASIQADFERQKSAPPIPQQWPQYAGAAVWANTLIERIEEQVGLIEDSGLSFVSEAEKQESDKTIEMLKNNMVLYIKNNFSQWLREAVENVDFEQLKNGVLFLRQTPGQQMLRCNFEVKLLRLFNEVQYWQKLPTIAQIPTEVLKFVIEEII